MKRCFYCLLFVAVFSAVVLFTSTSGASSNILFILDGSNSMWGQVDGVPKIVTAKKVLVSLLQNLPENTNVGIMVYGHRSEGNCKDVELLVPIGPNDPNRLAKRIEAIQPRGKTPLTYSLEQSLPLFASFKGQNNYVVLVSDGKETCGGDPCQTAKKLAAAGVGLKIHVVGFDVSDEERKQLECIAKEGKGRYFNAKNTEGFKKAFAQVKKEVASSSPAPKREVYFFDNFEGNKLKEHWKVINPNPDTFIVENGSLFVITSKPGSLSKGSVENLFRLTKPMPTGDWIITAKFTIDMQTQREVPFLGVYDDKDNYIVLLGYGGTGGNWYNRPIFFIEVVKRIRGRESKFRKKLFFGKPMGSMETFRFSEAIKTMPQPVIFRLKKKGRGYFASAMLEKAKQPKWVELEKVAALRAKGDLVLGIYQAKRVSGETTISFDWVKIETIK